MIILVSGVLRAQHVPVDRRPSTVDRLPSVLRRLLSAHPSVRRRRAGSTGTMFCLSLIEHNLPIPPHLLSLPLIDAIKQELERLFLDKVISNLGLCVSVYDIQSIEGGFIIPGDGASMYKVVFRLLMFRPFVGEVLIGRIETSDVNGLRLSLGFFSDIYVPVHLLQQPCEIGSDGLWVWKHESADLPLDPNEEIRFRVTTIKYPPIPLEQDENAKPFAPMEIIGEIYGDGLGLISWWGE